MSTHSAINRVWVLILLVVFFTLYAVSMSIAADNSEQFEQSPKPTPSPVRVGRAAVSPGRPVIWAFPTPRPVSGPGPITGEELNDVEKSSLAVVKLFGCKNATDDICSASEGSGSIIHPKGLILTALHVVIKNPKDLLSPVLPEISVEMLEKPDDPTQLYYRAKVAAIEPNLDLALLWLISPNGEHGPYLPSLPVENISFQEFQSGSLKVKGFVQGSRYLKTPPVAYYGKNDDGDLELDGPLVRNGFSGSPLLVLRDGRYHIGGVVFYRTDGPVLIQPMERVKNLRWLVSPASLLQTDDIWQLWAEDVEVNSIAVGGQTELKLSANVYALDLRNQKLRIEALAYSPGNDQAWPSIDNQLSLQRIFYPSRFVDAIPLELSKSLSGLQSVPDRLRFEIWIWDEDESRLLWKGETSYLRPQNLPSATYTATRTTTVTPTRTRTATRTPTPTRTPTRTPTSTAIYTPTPTRTFTATPNITATFQAVLSAALTALAPTPTPTPSPTSTPLPPYEISGIFRTIEGLPLAGIRMSVFQNNETTGEIEFTQWVTSDSQGRFNVEVPAPGKWSVNPIEHRVSPVWNNQRKTMDGYFFSNRGEDVIVPPNASIDFVFEVATHHISGTVLKKDGTPAANVWVEAHGPISQQFGGWYSYSSAITDSNGLFAVPVGSGFWWVMTHDCDTIPCVYSDSSSFTLPPDAEGIMLSHPR